MAWPSLENLKVLIEMAPIQKPMRPKITALALLFFALPVVSHAADPGDWSVDLVSKRYTGSHTSYEFGNPEPPMQAPLSRLEFPMNAWFGGVAVAGRLDRFSVSGEVLRNISSSSTDVFRDSDWTGEKSPPSVKDVYSESSMRIEPSYMARLDVDMRVGDLAGLPEWLDVRPVIGVRWQDLNFVTHDGVQSYPASPGSAVDVLSGDGIRFNQTYWQYFLGARMAYDVGRHVDLPGLKLSGQLDWAYVTGENRDHHLLRPGRRITYEDTRGSAWHAIVGLAAPLAKDVNLGLSFEYLRIESTGTHRWTDSLANGDLSWDNGVKVWSEQKSVNLNLQYVF